MSTYTPIATQTLSSAAASVTFSGIPQTYTDLVLVFNGVSTAASFIKRIKFNGDTGANYSATALYGTGSSAASARYSESWLDVVNAGTNNAMTTIHIMNYANTTINKTYLSRQSAAAVSAEAVVGLWRSTDAITSVRIEGSANNFQSGSTFTLYGIGSGSPKAFGGDEVRTDGTYWYHIYNSSGIFAPTQNLTDVDYLVVAGGGASGYRTGNDDYYCGGGGGGGLLTSVGTSGGGAAAGSAVSLNSGNNYTVTIGAGGTKVSNASGTAGNNSVFASITATGGGFGGYGNGGTFNTYPGGNGGSGGGSNGGDFGGNGGSAVSPTQGYAGGTVTSGGDAAGAGGGGGAGSAGGSVSGSRSNGGNGGAPLANLLSGSPVYYAGGGRGGRGYDASNGSNDANYSYAANTGSGGYPNAGANENGCSGIVIVRYAI